MRSKIASASVGSAITSCHEDTGSWLVISSEPRLAVLDDLHEVAALAGGEAIRPPIVEDKEIDLDQHPEQPREAAVAVGEIEVGEQARHARVIDRVAIAAGLLRQCTG